MAENAERGNDEKKILVTMVTSTQHQNSVLSPLQQLLSKFFQQMPHKRRVLVMLGLILILLVVIMIQQNILASAGALYNDLVLEKQEQEQIVLERSERLNVDPGIGD